MKLTFLFHANFSTKASQIENARFLPKTDVFFGLKGKFPTQKQTFLETFDLSPDQLGPTWLQLGPMAQLGPV